MATPSVRMPMPGEALVASPRRGRLVALLWLAGTLLVGFNFAFNLQQNGKTYLDAQAYTHYQEKRPYEYRVLMAPVMGALMHTLAQPPVAAQLRKFPVYASTPEAFAYLLINGVGLTLSCLLMVAIARRTLGDGAVRVVMTVYLGLTYLFLCLNPNIPFILPYDVPSLVLTQACVLAIVARRWAWLYPLFALATLNRETSFLVIVFWLATAFQERPGRRRALVHAAALCAVWVAIKAALWLRFSGLPSDEGLRLGYNLRTLAKPWWWPALLPLLGSFAVSIVSLLGGRGQRQWAMTACVGFAMIFVVGQVLETRAFADLLTFFALAIAQWLSLDARAGPARASSGR